MRDRTGDLQVELTRFTDREMMEIQNLYLQRRRKRRKSLMTMQLYLVI
jgi:hypothetical protein